MPGSVSRKGPISIQLQGTAETSSAARSAGASLDPGSFAHFHLLVFVSTLSFNDAGIGNRRRTRMLELLRKGLYERDFAVMTAVDGETGLEIATAHTFDAIVLDIGLPRLDGYSLMRTFRERGLMTQVLMLTARDAEDDIIRGFDMGADDYLTKPFSFPELVARLQSITRNRLQEADATIEADDIVIDQVRHSVRRNLENIDLTRLEFLLLSCLVRHAGQCVSRQALMESLWGPDRSVSSGATGCSGKFAAGKDRRSVPKQDDRHGPEVQATSLRARWPSRQVRLDEVIANPSPPCPLVLSRNCGRNVLHWLYLSVDGASGDR